MTKALTASVLRRLTSEALVTYLGQAEQFECTLHPGCCSATTGEPVADLNYIVAGHGATESGAFGAACTTFISKSLPFLAILFPEAGRGAAQTAADLGLVHVVAFPFMAREDAPIGSIDTNRMIEITRDLVRSFLDVHIRGAPAATFSTAVERYPEVFAGAAN